MKNFRIITLGPSGAGKTVFLGSLFKQLSTQGEEGFFLEVADYQKIKKLNEIYTEIVTGEQWPSGTRNFVEWTFACCVKNLEVNKYKICDFTYIDYAGGLLTDIDDEDEAIFLDFQTEVPKADAVLAIIDGLKLYKFMEDRELNNKDVLIWLNRDLPSIMQLVHSCHKNTPVHFIISKWDLLESRYSLLDVRERLLKYVPQFSDVVSIRKRAGCPLRLIPISSIGKNFATLQPDGSMKKNPSSVPKPFQVEVPLACVLIDRVKIYLNSLEKEQENIQNNTRIKTNFDFIDRLTQPYFDYIKNRKPGFLFSELEERLKEINNAETAVTYLVNLFLNHLQKFENAFPDANLGGEILTSGSDPEIKVNPTLPKIKLIHTLVGHQKAIRSVGFTSDGQILFSASHDKSVRFWSVSSGQLQGRVLERGGWVLAQLSRDDQLLFTTCEDKTIKVWNANTGKRLGKPLKGHSDLINALVVSPDGSRLVSGSQDKTVNIWKLENNRGKVIHNLIGHQGLVYTIAVSPDWRTLASAGSDKTIILWDIDNGKILKTLNEHSGFIRALAFTPDGGTLISGGYDNSLYVWDWKVGKLESKLDGHLGTILSMDISSDNRILVSGSEDFTVKLWDLSAKTLISTMAEHEGRVNCVKFSLDCQTIASSSDDNTVKIWRLN